MKCTCWWHVSRCVTEILFCYRLEKAADLLMACFRVCASDNRAQVEDTKKWGMLNLVNQLFKIYFKINKLHLCKPLIRAIDSLPMKERFSLSQQVGNFNGVKFRLIHEVLISLSGNLYVQWDNVDCTWGKIILDPVKVQVRKPRIFDPMKIKHLSLEWQLLFSSFWLPWYDLVCCV